MLGLLEIVSKAGAEPAGVGVAIEKATRDGGQVLRRMGLRAKFFVLGLCGLLALAVVLVLSLAWRWLDSGYRMKA